MQMCAVMMTEIVFYFGTDQVTVAELTRNLQDVESMWYDLGVELEFSDKELSEIKLTFPDDGPRIWMEDMLKRKMKKATNFGWGDVTRALERIGCGVTAEMIRCRYCDQEAPKGLYLFSL